MGEFQKGEKNSSFIFPEGKNTKGNGITGGKNNKRESNQGWKEFICSNEQFRYHSAAIIRFVFAPQNILRCLPNFLRSEFLVFF